MTKALAQLIVVTVLLVLNVAMSALLVPDCEPGKVPAPVLQLLVVAAASQLLLNGVGSHVALAAVAEWANVSASSRAGKIAATPDRGRRIRMIWFFIITISMSRHKPAIPARLLRFSC